MKMNMWNIFKIGIWIIYGNIFLLSNNVVHSFEFINDLFEKFNREYNLQREIILEKHITTFDRFDLTSNRARYDEYISNRTFSDRMISFYTFLDKSYVAGHDRYNYSYTEYIYITGRGGVRFLLPFRGSRVFIEGDIYGALTYREFMEYGDTKPWWDIRYLYISNIRSHSEVNLNKPRYILFKLGRIPVIDDDGLFYRNYLDGVYVFNRDDILNISLFIGTRFRDDRFITNEERTYIEGYKYIISNSDYRISYNKEISIEFIGEYSDYSDIPEEIYLWDAIRDRRNLNWINMGLKFRDISLKGDYIWVNMAYNWGSKEAILREPIENTPYFKITNRYMKNNEGLGVDMGYKLIGDDLGIGIRTAFGEGSESYRNFFLPKISNSRDYLFGPNGVKYYGELIDPNLNNMVIFSIFGGVRHFDNIWTEVNIVNYFKYNKGPIGVRRHIYSHEVSEKRGFIGTEMDVILNGEMYIGGAKYRLLLIFSLFKGSDLFRDANLAFRDSHGIFFRFKRYW